MASEGFRRGHAWVPFGRPARTRGGRSAARKRASVVAVRRGFGHRGCGARPGRSKSSRKQGSAALDVGRSWGAPFINPDSTSSNACRAASAAPALWRRRTASRVEFPKNRRNPRGRRTAFAACHATRSSEGRGLRGDSRTTPFGGPEGVPHGALQGATLFGSGESSRTIEERAADCEENFWPGGNGDW